MKSKTLALALSMLLGAACLAPTLAEAAPHHRQHRKPHKVCKYDHRHHHRVCHWVR